MRKNLSAHRSCRDANLKITSLFLKVSCHIWLTNIVQLLPIIKSTNTIERIVVPIKLKDLRGNQDVTLDTLQITICETPTRYILQICRALTQELQQINSLILHTH